MKAIVAVEQGSPAVLQLVDLPMPKPGPGQVLVKVYASSVNPIDTKVRQFKLPMTPHQFPAILHGDFAGVIEAVADPVSRFRVGDEVFGFAGGIRGQHADLAGALAEYTVVDAELIALKPRSLGFREAAALPLVAATAWLALCDKVKLNKDTTVLVHGGTGGVGHVAIQLAKAAGAKVFTTVSSQAKGDIARSLGADVAINYRETPSDEILARHQLGDGFDVVFDTVGGAVLDQSFLLVRPGGDVITVMGASSHNLAPLYLRGANLHTVLVLSAMMYGRGREQQGRILDEVRHLVDTGRLKPLVDEERFDLARAADAHRKLEAGKALGKLVIDVQS
ncbi:zinc-dependent alcohol dehydrogenase family protein [Chitinimonas arctica]|uniref:Zinc-dependent alcohol dehydrogenase family protein n=1 Tax=Chitinimonas arctica TaxID=2594795 RepID=A0A516SBI5_9NEIS|nr:zinc-dependent alcohol dehydrogenase family protein [Chitinimonas arctica]QDQ25511.1 zinc-dependent alcohol dehydrogenase family protein [Chitinimonas arctica]